MSVLFQPMAPAARQAFPGAYLDHLRRRDGLPDQARHRFDVREQFFQSIDREPVQWVGAPPIDQAVFDRNYARRSSEPGLDERTLWAVATAKANRSERYGIEYAHEHGGVPGPAQAADLLVYVEIEEYYHTRILRDALQSLGVKMEMSLPSIPMRVLIRLMARLPQAVSDVMTLCGEIAGIASFKLLLDKARELFAEQPKVVARIVSLFEQILIDEVGHAHFVRSRMGPMQLRAAKAMLPAVARGILMDIPELVTLFGASRVMNMILTADVDGTVCDLPERFNAPA